MISFFKAYKYQVALLIAVMVIGALNYSQGTYLLGWDNLSTELGSGLSIKRAFFSVWQEYQSLGLVSGLAHSADIVRSITVAFLSLFLPNHFVRFFLHIFLMYIAGLGILRLLFSINKKIHPIFAFLGSLFYLLNFGTVQILALPYDPFTWFFASLPWLTYIYLRLVTKPTSISKKDILIFFMFNFLATPSFYVQTQFLVYGISLGLLSIGVLLSKSKNDLSQIIKRSISLVGIVILVNSFWLLPQLYFLKNGTSTVELAKSNILSTDDTYYQNKEKGTLDNFLTFKGLYYDLHSPDQQYVFAPWKDHFETYIGQIGQWAIVAIMVIGLIFSKKKQKILLLPLTAMVAVTLLSNTFTISQINIALHTIPLFHQVFRSPFTKFIILYSLLASCFFTYGIAFLNELISIRKSSVYVVSSIIGILLIAYTLPSFQGHYFAKEMKVTLPQEYFNLFDYFKKKPKDIRIALLPDSTIWGWFNYSWGYTGSGFLWYGIEQPIVSRTFDVWSHNSESYHWELKYAIERNDRKLFQKVLDKYRIDYLILDNSVLPIASSHKNLQKDRLQELLASENLYQDAQFGNITVYHREIDLESNDFISILPQETSTIGPTTRITNLDDGFATSGNYITEDTEPYDRYYPYKDLFSETSQINRSWTLQETSDSFLVISGLMNNFTNNALIVPAKDFISQFKTIPILFDKQGPNLLTGIQKEKVASLLGSEGQVTNCGDERGSFESKKSGSAVSLYSNDNASGCISFDVPFIEQQYGYILKIKNKNDGGRRLFFYIIDQTTDQTVVEDRLVDDTQYYILPPRSRFSIGYSIAFQSNSYKGLPSQNTLESIELFSFPSDILQASYFQGGNPSIVSEENTDANTQNLKTHKYAYYLYTLDYSPSGLGSERPIITLWQSFDDGWLAYEVQSDSFWNRNFPFLFGQKLTDHVLVNNWANGWKLSSNADHANNATIVLFFWPQYLQYLGYMLLVGGLGYVLFAKKLQ